MSEVLEFLSAGGDVGVWALVVLMWRFDRRLVRLETLIYEVVKKRGNSAESQPKQETKN